MSSKSKQQHEPEEALDIYSGKQTMWGWLAALIALVIVAIPLSATFAFATHPQETQDLFQGRLANASMFGFSLFWWIATAVLLAIPVLVGFGVAKLHSKTIGIIAGVVVVLVILLMVFGQLFLF